MQKIKHFIFTTVLGGLTVILPIALLVVVFNWVFVFVTGLISPLTNLILKNFGWPKVVADVLVLTLIIITSFFVGILIRTSTGRLLFQFLEEKLLKVAPGYTLIKDAIRQLLSGEKGAFSAAALVRLSDSPVTTTALISDSHPDGSFTVFVPIGPTPTSGLIYHLPATHVQLLDISVEEAMRTIITCGAGSTKLVEAYQKKRGTSPHDK